MTDTRQATLDALTALEQLAGEHGRPELVEASAAARQRLTSSSFRVVVLGEYKQGKSSLINGLLDAPVCAVDDDIATAARLEIGYSDPAVAVRWARAADDAADDGDETVRSKIPVGDAASASTDPATSLVRVGLPRRLLQGGLVLVDTPGVGGIESAAAVVTASTLDDAHAALFVTDASQELTAAEAAALADAVERCPRTVLVETKIDVYPYWRDIVSADREHLARLGIDIPVVPASTALRQRALAANSQELNQESGFPQLLQLLSGELLGSAQQIMLDDALHTARRVYAGLREPLLREYQMLEAGDGDAAADELRRAKAEAEEFKQRVSGWQQVLSDGMADLVAAVDLDLRDRFRALVAESEELVDDSDPDESWGEFEPDLYRRTAEALDANLAVLRDHADALAQRLADAVTDDEMAVYGDLELDEDAPGATAERKETDAGSSGGRAHQVFRAGYGGAMPIMAVGGMALGVIGLGTLVLPVAAVAGVMAGRKALADERDKRLNQRRQQAKAAARKYTDETLMRASAERKQMQRRVQRGLRDHMTQRVKELAGLRQAAIAHAEAAVAASAEERQELLGRARAELQRVEQIAHDMAGRG